MFRDRWKFLLIPLFTGATALEHLLKRHHALPLGACIDGFERLQRLLWSENFNILRKHVHHLNAMERAQWVRLGFWIVHGLLFNPWDEWRFVKALLLKWTTFSPAEIHSDFCVPTCVGILANLLSVYYFLRAWLLIRTFPFQFLVNDCRVVNSLSLKQIHSITG